MLFLFFIIAVFLGLFLASLTQEELETGRRYLIITGIVILTFLIFNLALRIEFDLYNFLILGIAIVLGFLPFDFFSGELNKRGILGAFFQEFSKGTLVIFYNEPGFFFPLLIYSILEGSLLFQDNLKKSSKFVFLSQSVYLIGVLSGTLFWNQTLTFLSIGFLLAILSRSLYPRFLNEFKREIRILKNLI